MELLRHYVNKFITRRDMVGREPQLKQLLSHPFT